MPKGLIQHVWYAKERRSERALQSGPIEFKDFLRKSFERIEYDGGEVTLGRIVNGEWQEYQKGMTWDVVQVKFPGNDARYRSVDSFKSEYEKYRGKFRQAGMRVEA